MKLLAALLLALLAAPAMAQPPGLPPTPRPEIRGARIRPEPHNRAPANQARHQAVLRAALGDMAGGRPIPKIVLGILASPKLDPVTAYLLWQAARFPMDDWTIKQLEEITALLPTLIESGVPQIDMKVLYKFYGLDPKHLFNPLQFGGSWQLRSMMFDPRYGSNPTTISSAECAQSYWVMTVAVFKACFLHPRK